MSVVEGLAWSRQVLGEPGPHVRAVLPRVLATTHDRYVATNTALDLGNATPYGLMWLGVPKALVETFAGSAGVKIYRPPRAKYRLPVINGVPLVPWRYAKDSKTDFKEIPFGTPVSETRKSVFHPLDLQAELPIGEAGLGDAVLAELTPEQRQELNAYGEDIRALALNGLVAVLAYASSPNALYHCYFGYAVLRDDDLLQWEYDEGLKLPSHGRPALHSATDADDHSAFDAGPIQDPGLRPRSPLEGAPTDEPPMPLGKTGADD